MYQPTWNSDRSSLWSSLSSWWWFFKNLPEIVYCLLYFQLSLLISLFFQLQAIFHLLYLQLSLFWLISRTLVKSFFLPLRKLDWQKVITCLSCSHLIMTPSSPSNGILNGGLQCLSSKAILITAASTNRRLTQCCWSLRMCIRISKYWTNSRISSGRGHPNHLSTLTFTTKARMRL